MKKMLITGATGNIGKEVVNSLLNSEETELQVVAAVRNVEKAAGQFPNDERLTFTRFDFENEQTFDTAFRGTDVFFLLRPPHLSDVKKYFHPLLQSARKNGVEQIVFLSVQGADKSKVIPHNKIERLIQSMQFRYIFVRPSYFMQNLTTSLRAEIVTQNSITLPAARAVFNWVDAQNVGEAAARLMLNFAEQEHKAFDITGSENKHFGEVAEILSAVTGKPVHYRSLNPLSFFFKKKKEGVPGNFALVMTLLHFLPRIQDEPEISTNYRKLTGKKPTTVKEFIEREKELFIQEDRPASS
jgi:uncharacterized protein YbjT (DUF2867 family)